MRYYDEDLDWSEHFCHSLPTFLIYQPETLSMSRPHTSVQRPAASVRWRSAHSGGQHVHRRHYSDETGRVPVLCVPCVAGADRTEQSRAEQGRAFKSINLLSDSALAYLCQQRIRQYIHYFCIIHELLIEPFQQANYISFPIAAAVAPAIRLFHNSREYDIVTYELQSSWWQPLSDYLHAHTADLVTEVEEHGTDTALR